MARLPKHCYPASGPTLYAHAAHAQAVALSTGGWGRTHGVVVELEGHGAAPVTRPPLALRLCIEGRERYAVNRGSRGGARTTPNQNLNQQILLLMAVKLYDFTDTELVTWQ